MLPRPHATRTVTSADGTQLTMTPHGGQVLSWRPGGGDDRLWLSPLAATTGSAAVRGGVPVIFPRFAAHPLTDASGSPVDAPRHGFARTSTWHLDEAPDDEAAVLAASLRDDDTTRSLWPHRFTTALIARADATSLTMTLDVANPGRKAFAFAAALHTYLAVSDAAAATIDGLGPEPRTALGPVDEVHRGIAADGVRLVDPQLGDLTVTAQGFPDLVFWNPGPTHGLKDVPADGASRFVCLEAVALTPVVLEPGQTWSGTQHIALV